MKEALFVLLPEYAEWEPALLAAGLRRGFGLWEPRYAVKTVAPSLEPLRSIGGFTTTPDYTFRSAPDDCAALVLVGGMSWFTGDAAAGTLPLVRRALERNIVVGGICHGSMFLGVHGFLNTVHHTSNDLEELETRAGAAYTGAALYHADMQSVSDRGIVTANGVGFVEFARDMLIALDAAPRDKVEILCRSCKTGFFPAFAG